MSILPVIFVLMNSRGDFYAGYTGYAGYHRYTFTSESRWEPVSNAMNIVLFTDGTLAQTECDRLNKENPTLGVEILEYYF